MPSYTPAGPSEVHLGLDFIGSTNPLHHYFVGFGGGTANFYYEASANKESYAAEQVP